VNKERLAIRLIDSIVAKGVFTTELGQARGSEISEAKPLAKAARASASSPSVKLQARARAV